MASSYMTESVSFVQSLMIKVTRLSRQSLTGSGTRGCGSLETGVDFEDSLVESRCSGKKTKLLLVVFHRRLLVCIACMLEAHLFCINAEDERMCQVTTVLHSWLSKR